MVATARPEDRGEEEREHDCVAQAVGSHRDDRAGTFRSQRDADGGLT
jgi:hypothetical protein